VRGLWVHGGEGVRKAFFFEKKKQKTFVHLGSVLPTRLEAKWVEVFWFFFSKENALLP
jgi:hypothetical protein